MEEGEKTAVQDKETKMKNDMEVKEKEKTKKTELKKRRG